MLNNVKQGLASLADASDKGIQDGVVGYMSPNTKINRGLVKQIAERIGYATVIPGYSVDTLAMAIAMQKCFPATIHDEWSETEAETKWNNIYRTQAMQMIDEVSKNTPVIKVDVLDLAHKIYCGRATCGVSLNYVIFCQGCGFMMQWINTVLPKIKGKNESQSVTETKVMTLMLYISDIIQANCAAIDTISKDTNLSVGNAINKVTSLLTETAVQKIPEMELCDAKLLRRLAEQLIGMGIKTVRDNIVGNVLNMQNPLTGWVMLDDIIHDRPTVKEVMYNLYGLDNTRKEDCYLDEKPLLGLILGDDFYNELASCKPEEPHAVVENRLSRIIDAQERVLEKGNAPFNVDSEDDSDIDALLRDLDKQTKINNFLVNAVNRLDEGFTRGEIQMLSDAGMLEEVDIDMEDFGLTPVMNIEVQAGLGRKFINIILRGFEIAWNLLKTLFTKMFGSRDAKIPDQTDRVAFKNASGRSEFLKAWNKTYGNQFARNVFDDLFSDMESANAVQTYINHESEFFKELNGYYAQLLESVIKVNDEESNDPSVVKSYTANIAQAKSGINNILLKMLNSSDLKIPTEDGRNVNFKEAIRVHNLDVKQDYTFDDAYEIQSEQTNLIEKREGKKIIEALNKGYTAFDTEAYLKTSTDMNKEVKKLVKDKGEEWRDYVMALSTSCNGVVDACKEILTLYSLASRFLGNVTNMSCTMRNTIEAFVNIDLESFEEIQLSDSLEVADEVKPQATDIDTLKIETAKDFMACFK